MLRRSGLLMGLLSLPALAVCVGCTTCQSCDDYCGSYYGGRTGDWVHPTGRAGSVYSDMAVVDGDVMPEVVEEAPADTYYP
jgi:hypothetical protein